MPFHVYMMTAEDGWGIGMSNHGTLVIARTIDGGMHWAPSDLTPSITFMNQTVPISPGTDQAAGSFSSLKSGWVAIAQTKSVLILHTVDGGTSWRTVDVPARAVYHVDLQFPTPNKGFLMTASSPSLGSQRKTLYASVDGGAHWHKVACSSPTCTSKLNPNGYLSGMSFQSASVGWLTGSPRGNLRSWIYRTIDGGHTWKRLSLPDSPAVKGPVNATTPMFFNEKLGAIVLKADLHSAVFVGHTSNGGASWTFGPAIGTTISGLVTSFIDPKEGWAAGYGDPNLYRTLNGGRTWMKYTLPENAGIPLQLSFISDHTGSMVFGHRGSVTTTGSVTIWRTQDGGRTWTKISSKISK